MRILIVSQYFWPENMRINDLACSLQRHGHKVEVLTGKPNYPSGKYYSGYGLFGRSREQYAGIDVIRVPLIARGQKSVLRLALNFAWFALAGSLLVPFRTRGQFDAILVFAVSPLTQALPALMLKLFGRGPVHIWLLDLWPESLAASSAVKSGWVIWIVGILSSLIHRAADTNLVCSRGFAAPLVRMGVRPEGIRYLPNFAEDIYCSGPEPDCVAKHEAWLPRGFRIMFAGNVGHSQDFPTILRAAELLREERNVHWIIVGDGRASEWVEQEIIRRGLAETVHLMGRFPLEAMPFLNACADVMLVTLRNEPAFWLTLPGKIQSCMACCKPIITAVGGEGARVIHEAQCGIAVPPGDPGLLANAALSASKMPAEELRRLGMNGRAYFDLHFAREQIVTQLEDWMGVFRARTGSQGGDEAVRDYRSSNK